MQDIKSSLKISTIAIIRPNNMAPGISAFRNKTIAASTNKIAVKISPAKKRLILFIIVSLETETTDIYSPIYETECFI